MPKETCEAALMFATARDNGANSQMKAAQMHSLDELAETCITNEERPSKHS